MRLFIIALSNYGCKGALDGEGAKCRISISKNSNITCLCRLFSPISHVDFKNMLCPLSL